MDRMNAMVKYFCKTSQSCSVFITRLLFEKIFIFIICGLKFHAQMFRSHPPALSNKVLFNVQPRTIIRI